MKRNAAFDLNEFLLMVYADLVEFLWTGGGTKVRPLLGDHFGLSPTLGTSCFIILNISGTGGMSNTDVEYRFFRNTDVDTEIAIATQYFRYIFHCFFRFFCA